jgi:hypothetical protein
VIELCGGDIGRCTELQFVQRLRTRQEQACAGPLVRLSLPYLVQRAVAQVMDFAPPSLPAGAAVLCDLCARHWLGLAKSLAQAGAETEASWVSSTTCRIVRWDYRELDNLLRGAPCSR